VFRTSISRLPSGNDLRRFGILPCQIREARRSRRYHLARAYAVIGPRRETGATSRLSIGHLVTFEGIAGEMIRPSAFESSATRSPRSGWRTYLRGATSPITNPGETQDTIKLPTLRLN
jgi:hypothetical protein